MPQLNNNNNNPKVVRLEVDSSKNISYFSLEGRPGQWVTVHDLTRYLTNSTTKPRREVRHQLGNRLKALKNREWIIVMKKKPLKVLKALRDPECVAVNAPSVTMVRREAAEAVIRRFLSSQKNSTVDFDFEINEEINENENGNGNDRSPQSGDWSCYFLQTPEETPFRSSPSFSTPSTPSTPSNSSSFSSFSSPSSPSSNSRPSFSFPPSPCSQVSFSPLSSPSTLKAPTPSAFSIPLSLNVNENPQTQQLQPQLDVTNGPKNFREVPLFNNQQPFSWNYSSLQQQQPSMAMPQVAPSLYLQHPQYPQQPTKATIDNNTNNNTTPKLPPLSILLQAIAPELVSQRKSPFDVPMRCGPNPLSSSLFNRCDYYTA